MNDTQAPEKKRVLFVARDDGGCGFFRCKQPAEFLTRSGLAIGDFAFQNPTAEQLHEADLVILQNTGSVEASTLAKYMLENKIPFMTEFDDFVHHISPHNEGGFHTWNPSTLFLHRAMEVSRMAAGMTVSTPQLAREYFPYNQNVFVVPNYLDKDRWEQPIVKRTDGKIRIGWCGGNAHGDDLQMISKVLEKIVKERDGKVVFETMGMTRQELTGVFPMPPTTDDSCPSCGFEGTLHHHPGERLEDYPTVLAGRGWDIAVAPVIDNAFGNAKSDLKLKEYSAIGLPVVASPVAPYREAQEDGCAVILARTFEEWYTALNDLIDSEEKRREMVTQNKEWVGRYWIQDNILKTWTIYEMMIKLAESTLGDKATRIKRMVGI